MQKYGGEVLETSSRKTLILAARKGDPSMMTSNWIRCGVCFFGFGLADTCLASEDFLHDSIKQGALADMEKYRMVAEAVPEPVPVPAAVAAAYAANIEPEKFTRYTKSEKEMIVQAWIDEVENGETEWRKSVTNFYNSIVPKVAFCFQLGFY